MAGNSFGKIFTLTTAGESHGHGYIGIVDGCPPGLELSESDLQVDLDRRRPGQSAYTTQRLEGDKVKITAGVFEGITTGTPQQGPQQAPEDRWQQLAQSGGHQRARTCKCGGN